MKVNLYNQKGEKLKTTVELNPEMFEAKVNEELMAQYVRVHLANQRQGTAKAKGRSEVSGSQAKAINQKGSGGARRGSKRSPLLVGGGKTFGPSPRDYTLKMNRKQKLLAKKSAFSDKAINDGVFVFDNFKFDVPKTTKFLNVLKGMEVLGEKVLVLVDSYSYIDDDSKYDNTVNILKSARNIKNIRCQVADTVTTYEIVNADYLAIQKDALITIDRVNA